MTISVLYIDLVIYLIFNFNDLLTWYLTMPYDMKHRHIFHHIITPSQPMLPCRHVMSAIYRYVIIPHQKMIGTSTYRQN